VGKEALGFLEAQMELLHSHSLVLEDHNKEETLFQLFSREDRNKEI